MDRLQAMHVFARIVEVQSFKKAAESLALPPSTITRTIKDLEAHLGVQLLQRTTRRLSLTPQGSHYFEHCRQILSEIEAVESEIKGTDKAKGKLRVDITPSLARLYILPNIEDFQNKYPGIELTLSLSDRTVDLIKEGVDCVIRAGVPQDSTSLVAVKVASFDWIMCASPSYLLKHGEPKTIEDLKGHQAVGYLLSRTGRTMEWDFLVQGQRQAIRIPERIVVDDTDAYVMCGLRGLGLIRAASYLVSPHIRAGALQQILPGSGGPSVPLSVMYPQSRHLSQTVRAFVEWTRSIFPVISTEWTASDRSQPASQ